MAYDPKTGMNTMEYRGDPLTDQGAYKGASLTSQQEGISGNVATTPTGAQVNLSTGQLINGPITGASLNPVPTADFQNPSLAPVPDVSKINVNVNQAGQATLGTEGQKAQTLSEQIQSLNDQISGKSAYETQLQQQAGFTLDKNGNPVNQNLTDLANQLEVLKNESSAAQLAYNYTIPNEVQLASQGRDRTRASIQGLTADELRKNQILQGGIASKSLAVSAQASALQNNLATANLLIEQAVKAKFGQAEADAKTKLANLDLILKSPAYDLETKNQAAAQKVVEAANLAKVDAAKTKYDDGNKEILKYPEASSVIRAEMTKAVENGGSAIDVQNIAAKNGLKTAEQKKTEAEIAQLEAKAFQEQAQGQAVDPNTLQGMLNVYKSTGQLPSFGLGKSPLRAQFYAALGGTDGQNIVNDAQTNKAVRAGLTTALKTQQNQYSASQTAIGTLDKQLSLAKTYSDKVARADSPFINKYLLAAKSGIFGDPDTAAFNNIVKTASYEFAKILSGAAASIAGVTVSSAADAESLLNSSLSKGQFNAIIGLMQQEAKFRLDAQKTTIDQLQKDLGNVGSVIQESQNSLNGIGSSVGQISNGIDLSKFFQ